MFESDGITMVNGVTCNLYNVPVRKVYVRTYKLYMTQSDIRQQCSTFGVIESICFNEIRRMKGNFYRFGFVTFVNGNRIAELLSFFKGSSLKVLLADAWLQPEFEAFYAPPMLHDYPAPNANIRFTDLSVSCIEMVLMQMDMSTRIKTAMTHEEIRKAFVCMHREEFRQLDMEKLDYMPMLDFRCLLQLIGSTVEHLCGFLPSRRMMTRMELVVQFCTNLQTFLLDIEYRYEYYRWELLPLLRKRVPMLLNGCLRFTVIRIEVDEHGVQTEMRTEKLMR